LPSPAPLRPRGSLLEDHLRRAIALAAARRVWENARVPGIRVRFVLLPLLLPGVRGLPEDAAPAPFSAEAILEHARRLAAEDLEGRKAGTPGERLAAEYIAGELDRLEIPPPPGKERLQRFPLAGRGESLESRNVLGWIEGADESLRQSVIVLGGHLDHLGKSGGRLHPGADDNASGVAVILEIAGALKARRDALGRSVLLAFFGAEEAGRQGSLHFVGSGVLERSRIALMVNIDMIGRPLADQQALAPLKKLFRVDDANGIGVTALRGHPFLVKAIDRAAADAGLQVFGTKSIPVLSGLIEGMAKNRSDHAPFEDVGVPVAFFGSGESDDYHQPTDTLEKLRPALMARRADAVFRTILLVSKASPEELPPYRNAAAPTGAERADTVKISAGDLEVVIRGNAASPNVLSGLNSLVNVREAPGFNAFDPDARGASAGINFEHIISGHGNRPNRFAPRRGRYDLHRLPDGASAVLVRYREDCSWDVSSTLRYTVKAPHYVDVDFGATPRSRELFAPRDHAIFFFASYMNDVAEVPIRFRGVKGPGEEESWISADAPPGHADWKQGGTYRHVDAAPLEYDADHDFKLNSWSYDWPRYTQPFFHGRAARDMVYMILFDRAHSAEDEIRFSLFKFKLPEKQRPAWDFQYVVRGVKEDREYGFRARLVWKRWVSEDDCLAEHARWKAALAESRDAEEPRR